MELLSRWRKCTCETAASLEHRMEQESRQSRGDRGHARRITFEQITLNEAGSPIIIDQHYCDGKKEGCPDQPKAVAVSDVSFTGVRGTSSDEQAITLDCAAIGCNNIRMVRVAISSSVCWEAKHSVLQECSWNIRLYGTCGSMPVRESICWEVLDTVINDV
ncbi:POLYGALACTURONASE/GLYCOSIDE HYDROLASE FAMILY PROTEIN [Salix viminalis]|uniref:POLYGALACTURONASE/GLYCOSIDE HYDROLASE FAMILY PROTEIN n=1 Tax=Salix viminalis TaxID=40686 RepID=A0A9Q0ZR53_SALVM|nr:POLYGALACTURONASE/GLYCOSIDE HYDROLASE FAMILY PROTEIN [Salix viminalis]